MNIKEMIAVTQCFIHNKTGKEVQINFRPNDFGKLIKAYDIAKQDTWQLR